MSKEATLEKWLSPGPRHNRRRIVIYDFDGTLFRSPDRDEGEVLYLEGTGQEFPFAGWWGRIETLQPPIVPEVPPAEMWIAETVEAYRKDAQDKDTHLVLMTGRPFKIRRRVEEILHGADIRFHDYFYRGMKGTRGRDTFEIKINIIEGELMHPAVEVLEIWEDRPEHASGFMTKAKEQWKKNLRKIIVHNVQHFGSLVNVNSNVI